MFSLPDLQVQLNTIMQTVIAGKAETLSVGEKVVAEATEETQAAWKLPKTWSPNSQKAKDWTPVEMNIVPPVNINEVQREILCTNLTVLLEGIEKASHKIMNGFSPNDPNRLAIGDLIKAIAQALRDLKGAVQDMQLKEAKTSLKFSEGKFQAIEDKEAQIKEGTIKRAEDTKTRAKKAMISKILKIFSPILGAITAIIGIIVVAAPILFPGIGVVISAAMISLLVSAIIVGTAMTTYSVVDSCLGVTQKIMEAFSKWMDKCFPGENDDWKKILVKAVFVALVVVILIVAIVATAGTAVVNVASQTISQIIKAAILESIKQISIQATVITIMSSNVIPELFSMILLKSGLR